MISFSYEVTLQYQFNQKTVNTASIILCMFWASFIIMFFLVQFAPEYFEDEKGFFLPGKSVPTKY